MAKLSNSSLTEFFRCPVAYQTRYVDGLQKGTVPEYLMYGTRFHQMLEAHYIGMTPVGVGYVPKKPDWLPDVLEHEAQAMLAKYKADYPVEAFEVVKLEHNFELMVQPTHTYIGRFDMLVRDKVTGKLQLFETKTEQPRSKRNLPDAWIARTQGSLYVWAAQQIFGEEIDTVILNVCTRGTPGKQVPPGFRRDKLHRSPKQIEKALDTFRYVADQVDRGVFVENTISCVTDKGYHCDYYDKCHLGADETLVQVEPYSYLTL